MAVTLTEAQRAVVAHEGGALLVSAAAGSGKTKVLVDRLLRKLCAPDAPANIDEFRSPSSWRRCRTTGICSGS